MLDTADRRRIRTFAVCDNPPLHILRFHPVKVPDDSDDGNVDDGKDVDRCTEGRQDAEDQNQHRHYDERVWSPERKPNDPHISSPPGVSPSPLTLKWRVFIKGCGVIKPEDRMTFFPPLARFFSFLCCL